MSMTKDDYLAMGRKDAKRPVGGPRPFPSSSTSWQARAYWAGFHEGKAAIVESEQDELSHLSSGQRAHVRNLRLAAEDPSCGPNRRERLLKKIDAFHRLNEERA